MTSCDGNHEGEERDPDAVLRWTMLGTMSLDAITDLCMECSVGLLRELPQEPEGFEVAWIGPTQ